MLGGNVIEHKRTIIGISVVAITIASVSIAAPKFEEVSSFAPTSKATPVNASSRVMVKPMRTIPKQASMQRKTPPVPNVLSAPLVLPSPVINAPTSTIAATSTLLPEPQSPPRVLFAEIVPRSAASASDAFILLYNSGEQEVNLTGWTIKKKTSTGTESDFLAAARLKDKIIPVHRFFLLANDGGYTGTIQPDAVWAHSHTLASSKNAVILYNASGSAVDSVAWESIPSGKTYVRISWDTDLFAVQDNPIAKNASGD